MTKRHVSTEIVSAVLFGIFLAIAGPGGQGCSTLSIEFPVEERIGSGESGSISILTEC
jgi:hypothetical protein